MRILSIATFIIFFNCTVYGQLVNNGATLTIKDGASLIVNNDVNNVTGSIILQGSGRLELSGDLDNQATLSTSDDSTIKFYGTTNSTVTSGGADFGKLELEKTTSNLILGDDLVLVGSMSFNGDNNQVVLGSHTFTLKSTGSFLSFDNNEYFQADGSGKLQWEIPSAGSYIFPVGDSDDYSPLTVEFTATNIGANGFIAINVTDALHPQLYSDSDANISRYWVIDANDITDYDANLTGTYVDADISGTESMIKGASYMTDWSFAGAGANNASNTVSSDVTELDVDFTGKNFYGKANIMAFLEGPYNTTELDMNTGINGQIPLTSPYDGTSVASIPNTDIVDWIFIETREVGTPANVVSSHSLFIDKDGNVVNLDGTADLKLKDSPDEAHIAVKHRNHLGMRSRDPQMLDSSPLNLFDFTDPAFNTYGTGAQNQIGSIMAMISGEANGDGQVNAVDLNDYWKLQNGLPYIYLTSTADFNLDGAVNAVDLNDHWKPNNSKVEQLD